MPPADCTVLFVAANPRTTIRLQLDQEARLVESRLRASAYRDSIRFVSAWAATPDDFQQLLLQYRPTVLHFSGHGDRKGIVLDDGKGGRVFLKGAMLERMLRVFKSTVQLVVLNSCYSRPQAEQIVKSIPLVVGTPRAIDDDPAIAFAASFYRALGFGRSVQDAFDLGCISAELADGKASANPDLLHGERIDPSTIHLVRPLDDSGPIPDSNPPPGGSGGSGGKGGGGTGGGQPVREVVQMVVVVVDLSRYSDIAREMDQQFGPTAVLDINTQIQDLIRKALRKARVEQGVPTKNTGDGAILAFDTAAQASRFAEQLHLAAAGYNLGKTSELAQRHFRVGIWTDALVLLKPSAEAPPESFDFAGVAIANAVRLEGACQTGEVLISPETWGDLPSDKRKLYGPQEEVEGKRGERFRAHRRKVVDPAPWDAKKSEESANERNPKPRKPGGKKKLTPKPEKEPEVALVAPRFQVCSRLSQIEAKQLAYYFGMPGPLIVALTPGLESFGVWDYVQSTGRSAELPAALRAINRPDLSELFSDPFDGA